MLLLPTHPDQRGSCQRTPVLALERQVWWGKLQLPTRGREMRWLSTANFLRGSWLSSHTSFSGVNKCLVQSWGGGVWQLLLQKASFWYDEEKRKAKINGIVGEENTSIKKANEIHLVLCDEAAKQTLTIQWMGPSVDMSLTSVMLLSSWLFNAFWHLTSVAWRQSHPLLLRSSCVQYHSLLNCQKNMGM